MESISIGSVLIKNASEVISEAFFCGAEEGLNEPFVRLLMLVRAVNDENILEKEEIEY